MRLRRIEIARSRFDRCGTTASRARARTGSTATSMPPTSAAPPLGRTLVVSMPTVVVLPAPLGPSRPKTSPRLISNEIPSTALTDDFG